MAFGLLLGLFGLAARGVGKVVKELDNANTMNKTYGYSDAYEMNIYKDRYGNVFNAENGHKIKLDTVHFFTIPCEYDKAYRLDGNCFEGDKIVLDITSKKVVKNFSREKAEERLIRCRQEVKRMRENGTKQVYIDKFIFGEEYRYKFKYTEEDKKL